MITNEERREVARKLRNVEKKGYLSTWCKVCMCVCGPDCPVKCNGDEAAVNAAKKLADLIEPEPERTCRVVPMDAAGNPPYRDGNVIFNALTDGCSECGYPFDTENKGVPNYCENCGAKVVE